MAIIDRRLEGDDEKDLSGLALSLKIQSVFRDCQIILVSSYMGAVLGMLKNFDMICFRVDRGQAAADFAVEIRKRFTEAIKYHANALTDRHVPEAQPGTGGHRRDASSRAVYISYARACDDVGGATPSREEIVNRIEASLQTHRYDVRRDKTNLGYAGLISEFMKEIGRGGCVVAVISDKYLHSAFCMSELREVHLNQQF